ncbi:MAG: GNAT family N-acetyltransferase [Desulfobacteraceae bacterium]|nr:GNAT family N-acetyltransferase [Desulfobacteraceae bacterium]MBC2753927.1 GNAT family N-acetyltransferase [Desulfobacteraceae bacterium]
MEQSESLNVQVATIDDLDNLVELHFQCFNPKDHLIMVLGKSFMSDVYKWFLTSENVVVCEAEVNGKPIGFCVFCKGPYRKQIFSNNKLSVIRALLFRPWLVFHPQIWKTVIESFFGSEEIEEFLKKNAEFGHASLIGIHPDYRRGGYSRALSDKSFKKLYELGWQKIIGIAHKGNIASQRMMESFGFKRADLSVGAAELVVFTKELDGQDLPR